MKKSMILLGMLSIGYAYAQEGNVGINTENPKATLDIQPNADNLTKTTNEGIIAPKLTKERIAGIADANLVEGTLVYATDATYAGTNTKVAKITEKGYYFYNGTEWVKVQYNTLSASESSKWTNDTVNSLVKLTNLSDGITTRADDKNIFITDKGQISIGGHSLDRGLTLISDTYDRASIMIRRAYSSVNAAPTIEFEKARGTNANKETPVANESLGALAFRGYDSSEFITGASLVAKTEQGASIGNLPTKFVFNLRGQNDNDPKHKMTLTSQGRLGLMVENPEVQMAISNKYTGLDYIENEGLFLVSKGTSALSTGVRSIGSVEIASDINTDFSTPRGFFEGIKFKTSDIERMVITEAGKIKVNDLADSSVADNVNRQVVVDKDGVLKVGAANIGATTLTGEASLECNASNRGKMNFIPSTDNTKSDVFGICMRNKDGNYYWAYMVGGNNPTNGTGAFGSGL